MSDEAVTEQLVRTYDHTDDAGRAVVEVVATPREVDGQLHVPIEVLTTGERTELTFELPHAWSDAYPLVRLLESVGYGPGGVDMLVGERFPVVRRGGELRPALPDGRTTERDRGELTRQAVRRTGEYAAAVATFTLVIVVGAVVAALMAAVLVTPGLVTPLAITAAMLVALITRRWRPTATSIRTV
ncbi:hypothetical protein [Halorubrum vacuolatum]|uniref:hypothetical protein n=1 Tax=Halorubrum vacuolatum TaxID=63740 RepID=UPI00117A75C5|nr:hypothetical protein [Halorubrum vacuolatum]